LEEWVDNLKQSRGVCLFGELQLCQVELATAPAQVPFVLPSSTLICWTSSRCENHYVDKIVLGYCIVSALMHLHEIVNGNTTEEYTICYGQFETMNKENRISVTNEPAECEEQLVEVYCLQENLRIFFREYVEYTSN
jgi:hypothetical protein